MNQPTFADLEYECKKRKTRRELFLERMGTVGESHSTILSRGWPRPASV